MESGFSEKMDALDLILNALKDHEKRLDDISHRIESLFSQLSINEPKAIKKEEQRIEPPRVKKEPFAICNKWSEFKDICNGAKMVAFQIENNFFHVYSMINEKVFRYSEDLPNKKLKVIEEKTGFAIDKDYLNNIDMLQFLINGRLKCGLNILIKSTRTGLLDRQFLFELTYDFDPAEVKGFLSRELSISRKDIVEGKITY